MGGIAKLPSAQCEIDPITRMYQTSRGVEYPSAAFIGSILNENQVTPIFGSDSGPRTLYFNLASAIVNAVVASLTPVTATLLDEVVDVFQVREENKKCIWWANLLAEHFTQADQ